MLQRCPQESRVDEDGEYFAMFWKHEMTRIFTDRMNSLQHIKWFNTLLNETIAKVRKMAWQKIVSRSIHCPAMFSSLFENNAGLHPIHTKLREHLLAEAYPEPTQTSKIKFFAKIFS